MRKWHHGICVVLFFACPSLFAQNSGETPPSSVEISTYKSFDKTQQPDFSEWQTELKKMSGKSLETSWKIYSSLKDELGQIHYRAQQYYKGIPLENGVVVIHTFQNQIISINGEIIPVGQLEGNVVLEKPSAFKLALEQVPATQYYWDNESQNELLRIQTGVKDTSWRPVGSLIYCPIHLDYRNAHVLSYKFDIYAENPLAGRRVYINAEDGSLVATEELILHTDVKGSANTAFSGTREIITDSTAPGNYRLREAARGKGIETYNMKKGTSYGAAVDFTDADNKWNNVNANFDEVATDAHWGAEKTYDYFDSVLGRKSFDNANAKIISYVHYSNMYSNAFWNGSYMTYGDGNGSTWKPLISIDVCGHEIAHAVTTYSAGLVYSYESGALNESFSDVFGNAIEKWARPLKNNWKVGEDFTTSGNGIRDMSNPNPYNNPKYYKGKNWYFGAGDNGGVHYNSGVQNYWFYLITDGISGTNEVGNSFAIDKIGITDASKIAYRNLSVYLTKNSQYIDARKYSILAATDLFGNCSKQVIAVTNAWWVCGVGAKYDSGYVKANFVGDTVVCSPSKAVNFQNLSDNSITSNWYFGDGGTSTVFNPTYNYSGYGLFNVKLVAKSCFKNKSDSLTRVAYVKVDSTFDICSGVLMPKSGTDSVEKCFGFIYDDGGEGFYGALKQVNLKLKIPGATSIKFRFLVLDYENGFDSLVLFKTNTANANKLGKFTGSTLPFGGAWQTVTADALWLMQYSDPLVEGKGFKIQFEGIRNPLTLNLGNDTTICFGDSTSLQPQADGGYAPSYTYMWENGTRKVPRNVQPFSQTKYLLTLTDNCTYKSVNDSILVSVRSPLDISLGKDSVICLGKSVKLTALPKGGLNTAYSYSWTQGLGNNATHTVSPTTTTTYRVILSDGCTDKSDTAYQTIYVKPQLKVTITATDSLVCIGKSITLTANGSGGDTLGYVYNWNGGLGVGKSKTLTLNDTNSYTVTLTDGCSVSPGIKTKILYTYPALSLALNPDTTICRGSTVNLLAVGKGGKGSGYTYTWKHGKSTAAISENPSTPIYYSVTLSDACSPNVNDSVKVDLYAALSLGKTTDVTLCNGQTFPYNFSHSGGIIGNHAIIWTPGGVSGFNVNLNPGTGVTNYTAILSDGCTLKNDTTQFKITKLAPLSATITATPATVCMGDSIQLKFVFSGGKPTNYSWSLDGNTVGIMSQKIKPLSAATYKLDLTDGCSLPATSSASVAISPAAMGVLSVDASLVCLGTPVDFKYTSPDAQSVKWYFSTGDSAIGTGIDLPKTFASSGTYNASARITTSLGCQGIFNLPLPVTIVAYPKANFTALPSVTNIENPTVVFKDGSTGATNYQWVFGDGTSSSTVGDENHTYVDTGYYRAGLKVIIAPGCSDSVFQMVRIKDVYRLYMPSSFSPDGNGVNDVYIPNGRGVKTFHMTIYNRWGMKVFETDNLAKGWDGKAPDGTFWSPDTYPFFVEVIDTEGFRHIEKGTIVILD